MQSNDDLRARAAALFRQVAKQIRTDAVTEYKARHQAEVEKMVRLRALRLATKGKR